MGKRARAQPRLKMVLVLAMMLEFTGFSQRAPSSPSLWITVTTTRTSTVSLRLNRMFTMPTRRASALAPMEQTMAVVTQSPR